MTRIAQPLVQIAGQMMALVEGAQRQKASIAGELPAGKIRDSRAGQNLLPCRNRLSARKLQILGGRFVTIPGNRPSFSGILTSFLIQESAERLMLCDPYLTPFSVGPIGSAKIRIDIRQPLTVRDQKVGGSNPLPPAIPFL